MGLLTLLPMGVLQLQAALEHGYWYARRRIHGPPDPTCWCGCACQATRCSRRCADGGLFVASLWLGRRNGDHACRRGVTARRWMRRRLPSVGLVRTAVIVAADARGDPAEQSPHVLLPPVLRRRRQRAAGDAVVGGVAGGCALAPVRVPATDASPAGCMPSWRCNTRCWRLSCSGSCSPCSRAGWGSVNCARQYLPVGINLFGGQLARPLLGAGAGAVRMHAGAVLTLLGWWRASPAAAAVVGSQHHGHARSCAAACLLGLAGLLL